MAAQSPLGLGNVPRDPPVPPEHFSVSGMVGNDLSLIWRRGARGGGRLVREDSKSPFWDFPVCFSQREEKKNVFEMLLFYFKPVSWRYFFFLRFFQAQSYYGLWKVLPDLSFIFKHNNKIKNLERTTQQLIWWEWSGRNVGWQMLYF